MAAAPFGKLVVACTRPIDDLLAAFRTGDGVPYARYGADLHEGQAAFIGERPRGAPGHERSVEA